MRTVVLLGIAALFCVATVQGQDGPSQFEAKFKCNLKTIKPCWWCEIDQSLVMDDEVEKPDKKSKEKEKKVLHKGTDHELRQRKACVQVYFYCETHQDQTSRQAGVCRQCREKMKQVVDMKPYMWVCIGCGVRAEEKKDLKHLKDQEGGDHRTIDTCDGVGSFPHSLDK